MRAYHTYIEQQAQLIRKTEIWRLALGAGMAFAAYIGLLIAMITIIAPGPTGIHGTSPVIATFIMFSSIGGMALGAMLAARILHGRGHWALLGKTGDVIVYFIQALRGLWPIWLFFVILGLLAMAENQQYSALHWLSLVPIALPMVLLQTASEEILFRGYFQSQLAARFRNPLIWMILPSVLFGLLHFDGGNDPSATIFIMIWASCFGVFAADLTARTGNLGAAIAMHFANNLPLVLFYSVEGPTSGFALYTMPDPNIGGDAGDPMPFSAMLLELLSLFCFYLAVRIGIRR